MRGSDAVFPPRLLAAATALLSLGVGRAVSYGFLAFEPRLDGLTLIPGLLDVRYLWNRGISFSLFWQSSIWGSLVLSLVMLAIVAALARLAWRAEKPVLSISLGLIIGGALGNIADRLVYHSVFDYLAVHLGSVPLFVCNAGDILISLGVAGLIVQTVNDQLENAIS